MGFSEALFPTLAAAPSRKGPEYSSSRVAELGLAIALTMRVRYHSGHRGVTGWLGLPDSAWLLLAPARSRRPVGHHHRFLTAHRLFQAFTGTGWHSLSLRKNPWPGSCKPSQVLLAPAGPCRPMPVGPVAWRGQSTDHGRSTTPALTKASRRRTIPAYESATEARSRVTAE